MAPLRVTLHKDSSEQGFKSQRSDFSTIILPGISPVLSEIIGWTVTFTSFLLSGEGKEIATCTPVKEGLNPVGGKKKSTGHLSNLGRQNDMQGGSFSALLFCFHV